MCAFSISSELTLTVPKGPFGRAYTHAALTSRTKKKQHATVLVATTVAAAVGVTPAAPAVLAAR